MSLIDSSWSWFIVKGLRCLFFLNWFESRRDTLLFLNQFVFQLSSLAALSSIWHLRLIRSLLFHSRCLGTLLCSLIIRIRIWIWITDNLQSIIFLRILLKLIFFLTLVLLTQILKRLHVFRILVFVCAF